MLRNPALYGLPPEVLKEDVTLEERRADLKVELLRDKKLVKVEVEETSQRSEGEVRQLIVDYILKILEPVHIKDIIKQYRVRKDVEALHDDIVNFKKRHYSDHKDKEALHDAIVHFKHNRYYGGQQNEEALHDDIVNFIIRYSGHKDEEENIGDEDKEAIHDDLITAEWIFVTTNLILELPSAVFDQLSSVHKPQYALVSMLLSFTTMLICIIQLAYQGGEAKVGWRWRPKKIPWFYYPSPSDKPFGTVTDFIGLLCAIFQSILLQ
ncbi:hypothetical protein EZV62_024078 [Acer yangbiense]|uniref:Uncharacterized protein n=1 Tax=Acer yangbiense TaxID=1000413 RepID=A0A5C7H3I4_9ROSI|nr:hypothetical protein EZV62_024078 [Acer yangbiense]